MKTRHPCYFLLVLLASLMSIGLSGAEPGIITATVKAKIANVRGQPSLIGEVVTRLKKGDKVLILEELQIKAVKNDDPTNWVRIQMPANTPVWVNTGFLDTNANVVKPPKLNIRGGPGENYSVVGRLMQGEAVKPIRSVESWMEIECPTNAYAFLAADLIEKSPAQPDSVMIEKPGTSATDSAKLEVPKPTLTQAPPAVETVKTQEIPVLPGAVLPAVTNEVLIASTNELAAAPPALVSPPTLVTPPPLAAPIAQPNPTPPKRIVRREGTVSGWVSIVAPTGYTLKNTENGRVMNYLQSSTTNIVLKNYRGKKVVVTGEEGVDARWIETPVLTVQTLEIAPNGTK